MNGLAERPPGAGARAGPPRAGTHRRSRDRRRRPPDGGGLGFRGARPRRRAAAVGPRHRPSDARPHRCRRGDRSHRPRYAGGARDDDRRAKTQLAPDRRDALLAAGAPSWRSSRCFAARSTIWITEIVGASLALLGRVPDQAAAAGARRRAERIQVRALPHRDVSGSVPARDSDLFVPLLHHPDPNVRYWGATLLSRDGGNRCSAEPARAHRGSVATRCARRRWPALARIDKATALPAARALLADDVWYVRAHAARALGDAGGPDVAEEIAPLLADREWWVRLAAKESLQSDGRGGLGRARAVPRSRRPVRAQRRRRGAAEHRHPRQPDRARGRHGAPERDEDRHASQDRFGGRHAHDRSAARTR